LLLLALPLRFLFALAALLFLALLLRRFFALLREALFFLDAAALGFLTRGLLVGPLALELRNSLLLGPRLLLAALLFLARGF
jgi:hypothetical protein